MKDKRKNKKKILLLIIGSIIFIILAIVLGFFGMAKFGNRQLRNNVSDAGPTIVETEQEDDWEEGWVRYNGEPYAYNKDVITFLFMGIDELGAVSKAEDGISGGQADALFLVVMNPHDKSVNVVAMNRNIMTQVDVYDEDGVYMGQHLKQIALQHGYGDGMEVSCERTVDAVSRFFYDLPINAYVAINMGAIRDLNAAVGGVTLTVLEDVSYKYYDLKVKLKKGEEVTLNGDQAYVYISRRDYKKFDSASGRVERQKQYINAFIPLAKQKLQEDLSFALDLYKTMERYMVTDIDMTEFTYLVAEVLGYHFDVNNIYSVQGETVMGEEFEEFYADEEALYELMMELFYEPVEK